MFAVKAMFPACRVLRPTIIATGIVLTATVVSSACKNNGGDIVQTRILCRLSYKRFQENYYTFLSNT